MRAGAPDKLRVRKLKTHRYLTAKVRCPLYAQVEPSLMVAEHREESLGAPEAVTSSARLFPPIFGSRLWYILRL